MNFARCRPQRQRKADKNIEKHHIHIPMAKMTEQKTVHRGQGGTGLILEHGRPENEQANQAFRADGDKSVESPVKSGVVGFDFQCLQRWCG